MKHPPPCPCTLLTPETDRYESVTKSDFLPPPASVPSNNHRTLTFCTPVIDTGGSIEAPLGLSCSSRLLYRAGEGAQDTTAGPLAHSLPTSWTGPAGVELGVDTTYQHQPLIHQDLCRAGPGCYPRGTLCAGSRLAAKTEFDEIRDRYCLQDSLSSKLSTPSGHRGRQLELQSMYGNMAEINLIIADTKQGRKEWTNTSVPYRPRQSRDLYRVYDW